MRSPHLIIVGIAVCVGLAGGLALSALGGDDPRDRVERPTIELDALEARLSALEETALRRRSRRAPAQSPALAPAPRKMGSAAPNTAAADGLESAGENALVAASIPATEEDPENRARRVDDVVQRIASGRLSPDEKAALWRSLIGSDDLEAVIEALRNRSENLPQDPDAATDLGSAYASAIRGGDLAPKQRREFTTKAMEAFDQALALDETHWEARFSKSMMQAFAPAALGLAPAARDNLEVLLEQQRGRAARPEDANTYFFLANLRASTGDSAGARDLRQEAARLFPRDRRFGSR